MRAGRGRRPPRVRGIAAVVIACAFLPATAVAQLSPGKLSAPHSMLEGSRKCLECHDAKRGVDPDRCLACHELLRERIAAGRGLHARSDYRDCRSCHIEHHGKTFELIWWGKAGRSAFDHSQTGYPLLGAHAATDCRDCHASKNIHARDALRASKKNLGRTFLGLEPACLSCHTDVHRGEFGAERCLECHSMTAWKPADHFDHDAAAYKLAGRHLEVPCAKCHAASHGMPPSDADPRLRFRGIPFGRCVDCHRDEHRGQFPRDSCDTCHTVADWMPARFDHELSAYRLTGQHRDVRCDRCHAQVTDPDASSGETYRLLKGVGYAECSDCHRDPHEGRLGVGCTGCHVTDGWRERRGEGFDHERTRYPLQGRHFGLECQKCHAVGQPLTVAGFEHCATCHRDVHAGQFADLSDRGACEGCHSVQGFRPSSYSLERHQSSSFPLRGAHGALPCGTCHRPRARGAAVLLDAVSGEPVAPFRFESTTCEDCHQDVHEGRLLRFMESNGCGGCHAVESWRRIRFDHALTGVTLQGAHAKVECRGCHYRQTPEGARESVWVGFEPGCNGCHQDPHAGQFDRAGGPADCRRCHLPDSWKSLLFEHNRDSSYRLDGAHSRVSCRACHRTENVSGRVTARYRPLPTACIDCHDEPAPRTRRDDNQPED